MPTSLDTTKTSALTSPMPRATRPGPGQKPAMPQPMPKSTLPPIRRRSMCCATGSFMSRPRNDFVRRRAPANATRPTAMAPAITNASEGAPAARKVQKTKHLGRIGHPRNDQPEPENRTRQKSGKDVHDGSSEAQPMAANEYGDKA